MNKISDERSESLAKTDREPGSEDDDEVAFNIVLEKAVLRKRRRCPVSKPGE
ncbi:hypothetical protein [Bradyrhizobium centrosematis]|uniref:hypothetical protein n=1 Tax=Bradyrhizobium centrosematis TaxID=1300039 RepID=UPI0021682BCD|nr:hypothetical protein [Bradyrhizobium centrosematis]MCS3765336.1 hypothetical protein [Bradyrhizobium centrosematis]MCS3773964.1 hypothetical protein [Bradyrhizobium centrosematis]